MCGILFGASKDKTPVNGFIIDQFEDQHTRGTKGFGIIDVDMNTKKYTVSRATEPAKFMYDLHKRESACMIAHHRTPTSSPNYLGQTHPILVDNGSLKHKYLVIHNGCISNDDELKKEHEALGFQYTTDITMVDAWKREESKFNDTESLAIEVARFIEEETKEIGTTGSVAFIAVQIDKSTDTVKNIFFGRNEGSPLNMSFTRGKIRISSEGEGDTVTPFKLYSWDLKSKKLKKKEMLFKKPMALTTYELASSDRQMGFADKSNFAHPHSGTQHGHTQYPYRDESLPWGEYKSEYDDYNDEIEQIKEFRTEEVEKELESFFEALDDKDTTYIADVEHTLREIRLILVEAKKEAEQVHENAELELAYKINKEEKKIEDYNKSYLSTT